MEEKRKDPSQRRESIFVAVARRFLIKGLENVIQQSVKKDSSLIGKWTQGTDVSKEKRHIATNTIVNLSNFVSLTKDDQNYINLKNVLSTCREQAKNLANHKKKKDEGTFGKGMQVIQSFLEEFYTTLIHSSGYCLLKVKTNPVNAYEDIQLLTGMQKTIIFCENDTKLYYKDTIKKEICYIEAPSSIENTQNEQVIAAHRGLAEIFSKIACKNSRKATPAELDLIFLVTDKKACDFLNTIYDRDDAYSIGLYYMADYMAQVLYEGPSTGIVQKFVQQFVPQIDKHPEIIDKMEQCKTDLIILDKTISNYQAAKAKIVLGSFMQLIGSNKELAHNAGFDPSVEFSLGFMTNLTLSTKRFTSSEGRLGEHIETAMYDIKLSFKKVINTTQKIQISNQTPIILNPSIPTKNNATSTTKIQSSVQTKQSHNQANNKIKSTQNSNQTIETVKENITYATSNQMMQKKLNNNSKIKPLPQVQNKNKTPPTVPNLPPVQSEDIVYDEYINNDNTVIEENNGILDEVPKGTQEELYQDVINNEENESVINTTEGEAEGEAEEETNLIEYNYDV